MTLPYLSFKNYLRQRFGCKVRRVPLHLGLTCPNRDGKLGREGCIYCSDVGSAAAWIEASIPVVEQLQSGLRKLSPGTKAIAYFQPFTNTYGDYEQIVSAWTSVVAVPLVVSLMVGTRPDCLTLELLEKLADINQAKEVWLELGLQSANNNTLRRINRGHDVDAFTDAVRWCREYGLRVAAHVIVGLPGEEREDNLITARYLNDLNIDGVKIHSLYVLRGTKMEQLLTSGEYQPLTQDEYVATVTEMVSLLPADTVVMRLTGEGPPGNVIAPLWCLDKNKVLNGLYQAGCCPRPFDSSDGRLL